jgi:hypothetical protein
MVKCTDKEQNIKISSIAKAKKLKLCIKDNGKKVLLMAMENRLFQMVALTMENGRTDSLMDKVSRLKEMDLNTKANLIMESTKVKVRK